MLDAIFTPSTLELLKILYVFPAAGVEGRNVFLLYKSDTL